METNKNNHNLGGNIASTTATLNNNSIVSQNPNANTAVKNQNSGTVPSTSFPSFPQMNKEQGINTVNSGLNNPEAYDKSNLNSNGTMFNTDANNFN